MTLPRIAPRSIQIPRGKIRVLIVDDSALIRRLMRQALSEDPDIEVAGAESNGKAALASIPALEPDLVTLDIEMPEMDGLETLRRLRAAHSALRVIMFSSATTRGAAATFEALALGADDYVAKPAQTGSLDASLGNLRTELIPRIKQFFRLASAPAPRFAPPPARAGARKGTARILAIGVSTGGPQALESVVPLLPANFPVPVVLVQHMPPMFTRILAERLQAAGSLKVEEAAEGVEVRPGRVLIAPGNYHLRVRRRGTSVVAALDQGPHENSCRPSVDVLFRSVAEVYGGEALSVVLTGMGKDGLRGTEVLKAAGACSLVQDEATSVVWGMPGAIAEAGLADSVLPLPRIAPEIIRIVTG